MALVYIAPGQRASDFCLFSFRNMKRKISLVVLFICMLRFLSAQPLLQTHWLCNLPDPIAESSGLLYAGNGILWTHGDSDTRPVLYAFDTLGVLLDSIIVAAPNIDWETLASDSSGYLYIGDIGNNLNNRTDLQILKLWPDTSLDTAIPEVISFSYPDQHQFPGVVSFDCEAMFYAHDSLYLLSKNYLLGGNGISKLYRLPAYAGTYQATLIDSIDLGLFIVTGADLSPQQNRLVVLCYGKIILISGFQNRDFLSGAKQDFLLSLSQSEGIAFANQDTLYYSNEAGNLYRFQWPDNSIGIKSMYRALVLMQAHQENQSLVFSCPDCRLGNYRIELMLADGQLYAQKNFQTFPVHMDVSKAPSQIFMYRISSRDADYRAKILFVR